MDIPLVERYKNKSSGKELTLSKISPGFYLSLQCESFEEFNLPAV